MHKKHEPLETNKYRRILKELENWEDPHLMQVSSEKLNMKTGKQESQPSYTMCSACYSVIEQTWDHAEWCVLFKQEDVAEWLAKGKKNED